MNIKTPLSTTISFASGIAIAIALHFMLYRVSLPLKPFIYVAF